MCFKRLLFPFSFLKKRKVIKIENEWKRKKKIVFNHNFPFFFIKENIRLMRMKEKRETGAPLKERGNRWSTDCWCNRSHRFLFLYKGAHSSFSFFSFLLCNIWRANVRFLAEQSSKPVGCQENVMARQLITKRKAFAGTFFSFEPADGLHIVS